MKPADIFHELIGPIQKATIPVSSVSPAGFMLPYQKVFKKARRPCHSQASDRRGAFVNGALSLTALAIRFKRHVPGGGE